MPLEMRDLKLPSTLLHDQADACLAQCATQAQWGTPPVLQVDASALAEFDSSALAVLLGLRRLAVAQGGRLHITGMSARLRELASLYGVLALLEQA